MFASTAFVFVLFYCFCIIELQKIDFIEKNMFASTAFVFCLVQQKNYNNRKKNSFLKCKHFTDKHIFISIAFVFVLFYCFLSHKTSDILLTKICYVQRFCFCTGPMFLYHKATNILFVFTASVFCAVILPLSYKEF